jgi:predicted MFS family arabinose efflux permease
VRDDLRLLTDRRFGLLFGARTISVLGSAIAPVALAFAVLDLPGATPTTLGLVLAAQTLPEVLFLLLGGVIADRFPRYRVMVTAELAAGVSFGALATLFLLDAAPLPVVMALAAINGVATAMFMPALVGIVPQVVPTDRLQSANGVLRLTTNGARILGYAIAGGLVAAFGPGWALTVDALTFLVSAVLLAGVRVPNLRGDRDTGVLGDLRHGWREFASRQWLWVIVLQFSVLNAAFNAGIGVLGPVLARRDLGGAAAWSTVLTGQAIGMLLGVLVAMRIRPARPMLVATLTMFGVAPPFLLLAGGAPVLVIAAAALAAGVCFDVFGVLWDTALQRHIPPAALSRVSSYDMVGSFMIGPLGLLAAGPAAGLFGVDTALLGCAALILVSTALALLSPQVRQLAASGPVASGAGGLPGADTVRSGGAARSLGAGAADDGGPEHR